MISGSGTWTTILFRFASSWVSDEESSVVLQKKFFNLSLFGLVDEFLVISNNTLGNGLSDSIDLSDITTSSDGDSDIQVLESLETQKKNWFHNFNSQWGWLQQFNWWSVNSQYTLSVSDWGVGNGVFLFSKALDELVLWLWHCYGE